jgi:hypothetical protein
MRERSTAFSPLNTPATVQELATWTIHPVSASAENHALMVAIQEMEEALTDERLFKHSYYLLAELRLNNALKTLAAIAPTLAASYAEDVAEWKERTSDYTRLMDLEECARIAPLLRANGASTIATTTLKRSAE